MLGTPRRCQVNGCDRAASVNCFCCNTNICRRHYTEHSDAVKTHIDPLTNDISETVERIRNLQVDQITESSVTRLHQWKTDMYQFIDEIFATKIREIEGLIAKNKGYFLEFQKQQLEIGMNIQEHVKQLTEDEDVTAEQIQLLRNQLANLQTNLTNFQRDFLAVHTGKMPQGLVTISTDMNKYLQSGRNSTVFSPSNLFGFGTSVIGNPQATQSSIGAACSGFSTTPTRPSSTTIFSTPIAVSTDKSSSSGASNFSSHSLFDPTTRK